VRRGSQDGPILEVFCGENTLPDDLEIYGEPLAFYVKFVSDQYGFGDNIGFSATIRGKSDCFNF
jgi:hypothetical protein